MNRELKGALSLTITVTFLVSGCAETKTNQCREIISIANGTVKEAKQLTNDKKSTDLEATLLAADTMELAAEEMVSLDITDQQLQAYRKEFVMMYRETATATRSFVKAYENKDKTNLKQAQKAIKEATAPEQELVTKINQYCLE